MKTTKKLGIYIDYTNVLLMELINKMIVSRNIKFEGNEKIQKHSKNKLSMPISVSHENHESHLQSAYIIEISDIISNYNQVVLFGPNETKNELFDLLEFDHNFDHIKIENVNTGKMNEIQTHDFVKEYYRLLN